MVLIPLYVRMVCTHTIVLKFYVAKVIKFSE